MLTRHIYLQIAVLSLSACSLANKIANRNSSMPVTDIVWSADGNRVVFRRYGGMGIIDVGSLKPQGKTTRIKTPSGHPWGLGWSPNGKLIAVPQNQIALGNAKNISGFTIRVYDAETGVLLNQLSGHSAGVSQIDWSPDSSLLASISDDETLRIWDWRRKRQNHKFAGYYPVAWRSDGRAIATGPRLVTDDYTPSPAALSGKIGQVWDVAANRKMFDLTTRTRLTEEDGISVIKWSVNKRLLATGHFNGRVRLWNANTGKLIKVLKCGSGAIQSIEWRANDKRLELVDEDFNVVICEVNSGKRLESFNIEKRLVSFGFKEIESIALSPNGSMVAVGQGGRTIQKKKSVAIIRLSDGQRVREIFSSDPRP